MSKYNQIFLTFRRPIAPPALREYSVPWVLNRRAKHATRKRTSRLPCFSCGQEEIGGVVGGFFLALSCL